MGRVRVTSIEPKTLVHDGVPYRFAAVPERLLADPSVTLEEKGFLAVLMIHARPQRGKFIVYPGIKRLASLCGKSERTVKRLMAKVAERGLVARMRMFNKSTRTNLLFLRPDPIESSDGTQVAPPMGTGMACEVDVDEVDVEPDGRTAGGRHTESALRAARVGPSKAPLKE
jgi:hypothetical protein